jgi:predicted metal-dependent hydrolase
MDEELYIKGKKYTIKLLKGFGVYATAKLNGDTIEIKIPVYLGKEKSTQTFLNLKKRMIKSIERSSEYIPKPEFLEFHNEQEIPVMGKSFIINIREGDGKSSRARLKGNTIAITLPNGLNDAERKRHVYILSRKAISKGVLPDLVCRVNELNERHFQFKFNDIRIREQETRWGSYSRRTNRINLNFRLLFAPQEIIDSVIVHELAHIKEQNHSKRFWNLVLAAMPDYKVRRKWLRKNGNNLGTLPALQAIAAPISNAQSLSEPH